jgi:hypothetical protein
MRLRASAANSALSLRNPSDAGMKVSARVALGASLIVVTCIATAYAAIQGVLAAAYGFPGVAVLYAIGALVAIGVGIGGFLLVRRR